MKTIYSYIFSSIAIILSIVAICLSLPRTDVSFDYLGLLTGILGVLVTVLLGWNIYMIIDFRQERQELQQYFEEQKESVHSVGSDLRITFMNQLSQTSLLQKSIADVYAQLMGLNKLTPLLFCYLFHHLGAIVSASQAENYSACNLWIKEVKQTLISPKEVVMPVTCKQQLVKTLLQIQKSDKIQGLDEVVNLVAKIETVPDPIS